MKLTKAIMALIATAVLLSGTGVALWIAGIRVTGSVVSTNNNPPPVWEGWLGWYTITSGNDTKSVTYDNPDGNVALYFSIDDSGINSTNSSCVYESGKDFQAFISVNGAPQKCLLDADGSYAVVFQVVNGVNQIEVTLDPSPYVCPLNGNFSIETQYA